MAFRKNSLYIRQLILGKDHFIEDWGTFKRVLATGQLCLLAMVLSLFYLVFDSLTGTFDNIAAYLLSFGLSVLGLILIRKKKYVLSKHLFLICFNLIVFFFASREQYGTGAFIFFIPLMLTGFAVFKYDDLKWPLMYSLFSFMLFIISTYIGTDLLGEAVFPPAYVQTNFLLNFLVATVASIMVMVFVIRNSHIIEQKLLNNESHLKTLTQELQESKTQYELAIRGANAGIWDWEIIKEKVQVSPKWLSMLGYTEQDLPQVTYETWKSMLHAEDESRVIQSLKNHLQHRTPHKVSYRIRKQNGNYVWVEDTGIAVWNDQGEAVRMVGSISDIHARKLGEEKIKAQNEMLAKANEELDRFVYATSHDLRAPLMSILGLINIALLETDRQLVNSCLERVQLQVSRLDQFIKEIIDYARNARLEVVRTRVKPHELVDTLVDNLHYMDSVDRIRMDNLVARDFEIYTDRNRFTIIMSNLLSNAVKYHDASKKDPFIRIEMSKQNGKAAISVADNGEGISSEYHDKIFDMFYRASEKSQGSGLGLYIVKEMIEKLGGSIQMQSEPGEGTEFVIELPEA